MTVETKIKIKTKLEAESTQEVSTRNQSIRNRRRICSQTMALASQLNEVKDPIEAAKLSGALSIMAVAAGFQDDQLAERLLKAASRLTGGQ